MAVLSRQFDYEINNQKFGHSFQFNWTIRIILLVLLFPLIIHYSLLMCASIAVAYAVHGDPKVKEKILSLMMFVLWSFAGFLTTLAGLVNVFKFTWSAIVIGLVSLFTAVLLEYSLTIYEYSRPKFSAFAHIIILFQLMLIIVLSMIAIRLRARSWKKMDSLSDFEMHTRL